jgi:hypothetical protein
MELFCFGFNRVIASCSRNHQAKGEMAHLPQQQPHPPIPLAFSKASRPSRKDSQAMEMEPMESTHPMPVS